MQSRQSLPKEVRYAQYIVYTLVILDILSRAIYFFFSPVHSLNPLLLYSSYITTAGAILLYLFMGWQLGRLRLWARMTLIVLASVAIFGSVAASLVGIFIGLRVGSGLYHAYLYGNYIVFGAGNVLLLYYLTRPVVRDTFQQARRSRTTDADASQHQA